jgi:hypothetical protein
VHRGAVAARDERRRRERRTECAWFGFVRHRGPLLSAGIR